MATSLDNYPNSYDLMAIKPIEKILVSYFCDISWAYDFQEATLETKKEILREIALEIDRACNPLTLNNEETRDEFLLRHRDLSSGKTPSCGEDPHPPIRKN